MRNLAAKIEPLLAWFVANRIYRKRGKIHACAKIRVLKGGTNRRGIRVPSMGVWGGGDRPFAIFHAISGPVSEKPTSESRENTTVESPILCSTACVS